ncbi:TPA: VWA domain-containing protein [Klebsiella pneumoniae]|nr:putative tellurium resistance protein [Klebsiella phage vB_KpM_FBKp34]UYL04416.1 hypothetical protein EPNKCIFM_00114 [Klebsiella phage KP13-16]HBT0444727.1 VWA domain-containing protein [Klebsiella pneumoniae]HBT8980438.1 VWA domain-containing protein [Klebsiella pneumoniae]
MSNKLSLEKRTETVKLSLEKAGVQRKDICLRVALALDKSGSAEDFYRNGQFEELVDRLLPVSANMDDDGTIDTWLFHTRSMEVEPATPKNYGGYISNVIMKGKYKNEWGGTNYAPVMKDIHHHYFGKEEKKGLFGFGKAKTVPVTDSDIPALVFFITDGSNSDRVETLRLLDSIKDEPVYWMTVGVGPDSYFTFLREIAERYDNVGFVNFNNLNISDEQMYNAIIDGELAAWINKVS